MFKIVIARKQPNEKYGLGNDPSPPRGLKEARVRTLIDASSPPGGGGTPIHYLYGYVPPKGVVILKLLV